MKQIRNSKYARMNRFLGVLTRHEGEVTVCTLPSVLHALKKTLDASSAEIEVMFPYFISKRAPVSGAAATIRSNCTFFSESNGRKDGFMLAVEVPLTTLRVCSKEISNYGAHNQHGYVTMQVRTRKKNGPWDFVWSEDVIAIAEKPESGPVCTLLKRPDERHVTMRAFDKPVFVEDEVRDAASNLKKDKRVTSFEVRAVNHESIRDHSAFAVVSCAAGLERIL